MVTKPTPLEGKYFAINSFGLGGANGHILLTPHDKIKKFNTPANHGIPLLVAVSGRTAEAVDYIIDDVIHSTHLIRGISYCTFFLSPIEEKREG